MLPVFLTCSLVIHSITDSFIHSCIHLFLQLLACNALESGSLENLTETSGGGLDLSKL